MAKTFLRGIIFLCIYVLYTTTVQGKELASKQKVITQMNYCISSLTNIIHNKSMPVLEHESDQIVNNLNMEQTIGLTDINDFHVELLDAISKFEITEEEKQLMRRIGSIKRDNMKWAALSNALSPTMFVTGSQVGPGTAVQMGFQVLTTTARSVVEYKQMQGNANIEDLQAMWNLRKEDLLTINNLRKTALNITFNLYNKYRLSDSDRLTESSASAFCVYINEENVIRKIRLLEANFNTYKSYPDYYYYLGMAYLDASNYSKAKLNFQKYIAMYSEAPILRYDEKTGCIALSMLTYNKRLSQADKQNLIEVALKNLPHNSAAVLQCALVYIYELNNQAKGLSLILSGIDDPEASDYDALFLAAAKFAPLFTLNSSLYRNFNSYFQSANLGVSTFLLWENRNGILWKPISKSITFSDYTYRKWYQLWIGKYFDPDFNIKLPKRFSIDKSDTKIYWEHYDQNSLEIVELKFKNNGLISDEDINDIDCFKADKDLKYLFVETSEDKDGYYLKGNIDINKIKSEEYPRLNEFTLTQDDIDDIVDFCENHKQKDSLNVYECEPIDTDFIDKYSVNGVRVRFKGKELLYVPHHSILQEGDYVKVIFNNGINLMFKFDNESKELVPYLYTYNGNFYFANSKYKKEYETLKPIQKKEEIPWYKDIWLTIKDWFHKSWAWVASIF